MRYAKQVKMNCVAYVDTTQTTKHNY